MEIIPFQIIWRAIYLAELLFRFWFLIIGMIIIELFLIKFILKFSWRKSFLASLIGNSISCFLGTIIMIFVMIIWHFLVDWFLPDYTFNLINWVATFLLMLLGSVFLETFAIKIIYKEKIKKIFLSMLIGNFISYAFIAFTIIKREKEKEIFKTEKTLYVPNKKQFILLDKSSLTIDTSSITINYNRDGKCLPNATYRGGYYLYVPFKKQIKESFQFDLRLLNEEYSGGIADVYKEIYLTKIENEYTVLLEQKNTDTTLAWEKPIITDTIVFKKLNKGSH
jgi:hypothetical protein